MSTKKTTCNICGAESHLLFNRTILNKYDALYYRCDICDFMQTEKPYWLKEAYSKAITTLDVGLVARNLILRDKTVRIIKKRFQYRNKVFLDYAGGYGLFTRLMRDMGFNFYNTDQQCQNIFAEHFDLKQFKTDNQKFELLTAFEVMEHLEKPLEELEKMFKFSESILFSTEMQPKVPEKITTWWYLVPEIGQHISFYSEKTLRVIANKFNCKMYSDGKSLHLFTNKTFKTNPLKDRLIISSFKNIFHLFARVRDKISRDIFKKSPLVSLVSQDFYLLKEKLNVTKSEH